MKRLLLFALLALPLAAQQRFSVSTGNAVLSAAATAVTVQQPALVNGNTVAATVTLESATVYCSVACVVTQTQNATAATATVATPVAISPSGPAAIAQAFTASNFSGGTTVPPVINVPAGQTISIDLSRVTLPKGGSGVNYTVGISSITGTANITMIWKEQL